MLQNTFRTKGRTSTLFCREYRASCGASFDFSKKLHDRETESRHQMEWVWQMNACKAQAEEIVKIELIYD